MKKEYELKDYDFSTVTKADSTKINGTWGQCDITIYKDMHKPGVKGDTHVIKIPHELRDIIWDFAQDCIDGH